MYLTGSFSSIFVVDRAVFGGARHTDRGVKPLSTLLDALDFTHFMTNDADSKVRFYNVSNFGSPLGVLDIHHLPEDYMLNLGPYQFACLMVDKTQKLLVIGKLTRAIEQQLQMNQQTMKYSSSGVAVDRLDPKKLTFGSISIDRFFQSTVLTVED